MKIKKPNCSNWPRCGCIMQGFMKDGNCDTDPPDNEVLGYIYTHADCPSCNENNELMGDRSGEKIICDNCGFKFRVREVR